MKTRQDVLFLSTPLCEKFCKLMQPLNMICISLQKYFDRVSTGFSALTFMPGSRRNERRFVANKCKTALLNNIVIVCFITR